MRVELAFAIQYIGASLQFLNPIKSNFSRLMSAGKGKGTSADATSAAVDKKTPQVQRVIEHMQNIGNFIGALDGYEPTVCFKVSESEILVKSLNVVIII